MAALAMVTDPGSRRNWRLGLFIVVLMSAYGYGVVVEANAMFDRSESSHFNGVVITKGVSTGEFTTRYLRLEPWGPDGVCMVLRPGALAIPRYVVRSCW